MLVLNSVWSKGIRFLRCSMSLMHVCRSSTRSKDQTKDGMRWKWYVGGVFEQAWQRKRALQASGFGQATPRNGKVDLMTGSFILLAFGNYRVLAMERAKTADQGLPQRSPYRHMAFDLWLVQVVELNQL